MSGKNYRKSQAMIKKQTMKQTLRIKSSQNGLMGQVYIRQMIDLAKFISFKFLFVLWARVVVVSLIERLFR